MRTWNSRFGVTTLSLAALAAGYFGGRPLMERVEFARAQDQVNSTRQQLSTVEDLSTVFRHVGQVIEPSVVQITVKEHVSQQPDMLRRFFRDHGDGDAPVPNGPEQQPEQEQIGTGSGVIMESADGFGYILTNNHVAGSAQGMTVTLSDGRQISTANCKLLGADPKSDLAVVRIKADRLINAHWGNSDDLEKGDWIMAFGSPLGYIGSMTHGIVSALHRDDVSMGSPNIYENFIQVDAAINPGNSGGPLVNIHGEVVGINTAIATVTGGFQGIGFAIPSNQAKLVYDQIKAHGKVVRGWLGIKLASLSTQPGLAQSFNYTGSSDVLVDQTFPHTPASGKLMQGDIIESYNGTPVTDAHQLRDLVAATDPGHSADLKVFRQGKDVAVQMAIGDQPDNLAAVMGGQQDNSAPAAPGEDQGTQAKWGLTLKTLDNDLATQLGLHNVTGAAITNVDPNSIAGHAHLMPGMVITTVGDTKVDSAAQALAALDKADIKQGIRLYIATPQGSGFYFLQQDQNSGN